MVQMVGQAENDRLWNPGDEIWFAECDGDPLILNRDGRPYCYSAGGQFTGSVIRHLIIFTEFGGLGLEKGYVALYLHPLHRRLENLPVETFTKAQITGARYASRPVFGNLDEHPEWDNLGAEWGYGEQTNVGSGHIPTDNSADCADCSRARIWRNCRGRCRYCEEV